MRRILFWLTCLIFLLSISVVSASSNPDGDDFDESENGDDCPDVWGNSTFDRLGCLDSDGDGYSDPDSNWTAYQGADAFPSRNDSWLDLDGDGYPNHFGLEDSDDCPFTPGQSKVILKGCSDIDRDYVPDLYDDDADGDGIRNEMERAASTGLNLFDPFSADSTPSDVDFDTIPDVLDDDNDNDGWPDEIEIERNSDPLDADQTPLNQYFGFQTGIIYHGGLTFDDEFDEGEIEISLSWFISVLTGELVIPIALIPVYVFFFVVRRRKFNTINTLIQIENDPLRLRELEAEVNELVRSRSLKVYHGLVLRNTIEQRENDLSLRDKSRYYAVNESE
ncbi:MAG: hypothetical protein QGH13_00275 [Candidatus Thalassarchaeaceae archaeon]|nr:hypothetical protein [Candidatus Thalassarchaeaceae archaeon]